MARFTVYLEQVMSTSIEVEADSKEAAEEAVWDNDVYQNELPGSLCAQCSGYGQSWSIDTSGEWVVSSVEEESS